MIRPSLAVAGLVLLSAHVARAHDVRGTAVFLDVGARAVEAELQLPIPELALALGQPIGRAHGFVSGDEADELMSYVRTHLRAKSRSGTAMPIEMKSADLERIDDGDSLVVRARMKAPVGESARFLEIAYDGIVHRVMNHNIFVFVRRDLENGIVDGKPELVGVMHYQNRALVVDRTGGSAWRGLKAMFRLGMRHIADGTDHLLFLLMLLLPAPLLVAGHRWREPAPVRASVMAIVRIVSAFTLGHSITLVVAAVHGASLPARPVEVLIAISILVSAVHAMRPLFAGKEALVAASFGLVHGLAFATALTAFGFDRASLAISVLGFNLGVEAMQIFVVAITMPWLILASRSRAYGRLRVAGAALGLLASAGWIAQRGFGLMTPIPDAVEFVAAHARWIVIALAALAIVLTWTRRQGSRRHTTANSESAMRSAHGVGRGSARSVSAR